MKLYILLSMVLLSGCIKENKATVSLYSVNNENMGIVTLQENDNGVEFLVDLYNIPKGAHGFHIHEFGKCEPSVVDGKEVSFGGAGSHYDPDETKKHLGPNKNGHKGDLPVLTADSNGEVKTRFYKNEITLDEIKGKSLILHKGGDNYADTPLPLGGGGERIGCGVIK